jgi:16S rRNA (adenine1518-N6/adenine1519-N6)-dimethyltransferase
MVKKKLGQHFLTDTTVAEREVAYASLHHDDVVLEIGPGTGVLTRLLAQRAQQVIAIEIDAHLVQQLRSWVPDNVYLIHGNAVKTDFTRLPPFSKIVANLPFHISSPITFKFLQHRFSKAILMYQKDFADRMIASPRCSEYSRLSVGVQYKAHCRILETVPRNCFYPQPNIDSCIVELIPREKPPFHVSDESFFFDVTRKLFTHRRKKIKNSLAEAFDIQEEHIPYQNNRVEELTPEQIGELSNSLQKLVKR